MAETDREQGRERLRIVIEHWMGHNQGHAREFVEWAGKASDLGIPRVSEQITQAAEQLEKANESLQAALNRLEDG